MKHPRFLLAVLVVLLGAVALPAQTAAKPAAKPQLPLARIAWVNSNAFVADEGGIKQLVKVFKELELEFSGTQSELSLLGERLRTIAGELNKLQANPEANAQAIKDKQIEGGKLQQEIQIKQQRAQAAIGQAQQEKQAPVTTEIGKALNAYAKEREISIILDVAKIGDGILSVQPELEVTQDFIAYFNASHP